jgi:hypothetical protein
MRRFLATIVFAVPFLAWSETVIDFGTPSTDTTNTVLMVDQRGNLNVEGVASVEDVATNAAKVVVAEQNAEIAQQTATAVSNSIDTVVQNLMANNKVIYRSGFSDSFAPIVVFTDSDVLAVVDARWITRSAAQLVVEIDYACTVNLGTTKPTVMHRATIDGSRQDFAALSESNVTAPVYHADEREYGGQTFAGYYTITATIPNPSSTTQYFIWIRCEADAPSGQGATLDLPNGVTGGVTETVTWGDRVLTFTGGVLMGVE